MAATSVESPSPILNVNKGSTSSPKRSPSSDEQFWSGLRNRIDTLLENRRPINPILKEGQGVPTKRVKEDSLLLLRGFDSVSYSLSQLSNDIHNALQGARDLTSPPTLVEIVNGAAENTEIKGTQLREEGGKGSEEGKRGLKRKLDPQECCDDQGDDSKKESGLGKLNQAKNIAISLAKKAASLARELKSIKSDLGFVQERCTLLEEENRRLRDGVVKNMRPEEDDLVRLQLEALLAEKSRLANENANLTRENQCLHQLVEYHQLTSQGEDLSDESYEHVIRGMCLDFSSPIPEEQEQEDKDGNEIPKTPIYGFSNSLDECNDHDHRQH